MPDQNDKDQQTPGTAFSAGAQSVSPDKVVEDFHPPAATITHSGSSTGSTGSSLRKKAIITIAGALILVGGISTGVLLVGRGQKIPRSSAESTPEAITNQTVSLGTLTLYDTTWSKIDTTSGQNIGPGTTIRVAVGPVGGVATKARFIINDQIYPETTALVPGSNMFYYEFDIPQDLKSLNIKAQLYVEGVGWIN